MQPDFSPKQVARALGASESSVKRWCDKGVLKILRTAGGHRRISIDEVFSFLRAQNRELEHPEVLGLPVSGGCGERVLGRARENLLAAIKASDEASGRRIVLDLYAAGHSLATIFDQVIAEVFSEIGNKWECGDVDIYQERYGCEIANRIMLDLCLVVAPPKSTAPLAIGGSLSGDHYTIASAMVEVLLKSLGWRVQRIGPNLPFESMLHSIRDLRPRLFWLSIGFIENEEQFVTDYNQFYEAREPSTSVVLGGRAITPEIRKRISFSSFCDNMGQLFEFTNAISTTELATGSTSDAIG